MKKVLISCATHNAALYIDALQKENILPILSDDIEDANDYDGLLLPGGGDICPLFYHRKNHGSKNISVTEDIIQLLVFHRFYELQKPILGICKGMQLINVALGGTLLQMLPTKSTHILQECDCRHTTTIQKGSLLSSLYGTTTITNSAHHQAVCTLGNHLLSTQYAFDGVIEGIEHKSLPILGVQWHPERLFDSPLTNGIADGSLVFQWLSSAL